MAWTTWRFFDPVVGSFTAIDRQTGTFLLEERLAQRVAAALPVDTVL